MSDKLIVTIVGFLVGLITLITPLIKLNGSITKLNVIMDIVNNTLSDIEKANKNRDDKLEDHEIRIDRLEHK